MATMQIGEKIRQLRLEKDLSQGDIERRTGLLRCYTSRVEHGITVPSVETLEKYARALEIPLYKFFYEGDTPPKKLSLPHEAPDGRDWGSKGKHKKIFEEFHKVLSQMNDRQLKLIVAMAEQMARVKQEEDLIDARMKVR
ncbi:MAG TPA: helix-turn-helix domain-containing protein [Candidatus Limnocylindrales bacterium]|nr:helix-turn-helix domain-containing protein [Candidatus Limnocylindrales bacterium]